MSDTLRKSLEEKLHAEICVFTNDLKLGEKRHSQCYQLIDILGALFKERTLVNIGDNIDIRKAKTDFTRNCLIGRNIEKDVQRELLKGTDE